MVRRRLKCPLLSCQPVGVPGLQPPTLPAHAPPLTTAGDLEATVACRELGLPLPGRTLGAMYGAGAATAPIVLSDISCTGQEGSLENCAHATWYAKKAGNSHARDVSIVCGPGALTGCDTVPTRAGCPGEAGQVVTVCAFAPAGRAAGAWHCVAPLPTAHLRPCLASMRPRVLQSPAARVSAA